MDHRTGLAPSIADFADLHIAVLTPMVVVIVVEPPRIALGPSDFQSALRTSYNKTPLEKLKDSYICMYSRLQQFVFGKQRLKTVT